MQYLAKKKCLEIPEIIVISDDDEPPMEIVSDEESQIYMPETVPETRAMPQEYFAVDGTRGGHWLRGTWGDVGDGSGVSGSIRYFLK